MLEIETCLQDNYIKKKKKFQVSKFAILIWSNVLFIVNSNNKRKKKPNKKKYIIYSILKVV